MNEIVKGQKYKSHSGLEVTVREPVGSSDGSEYVLFEYEDGTLNVMSKKSFHAAYKPAHGLKPGDVFRFNGNDAVFLYLSERKVLRFGKMDGMDIDTSHANFDWYRSYLKGDVIVLRNFGVVISEYFEGFKS